MNDAKLRAMPLDVLLNGYEEAVYRAWEYGDEPSVARKRAYRREVERRITPLADPLLAATRGTR